ncbi:MAG TPA: flagellar hook protein FlgE [Spirochaetia bacterium]|nr:flagellar hook protein FlgE [Spirochaetia bacterium]
MMRALWAGVSGLENHQTRMDVIGNNIANVNTVGYKKDRVNFQDLLSQTMQGAAAPNDQVGGVNPQQVGLGMTVASIDKIFTQGALQTTGKMDDLAIEGDGFFVLKDGAQSFYTRAGDFSLDSNGTLVNPADGMRVQGWTAQSIGNQTFINSAADPGNLVIPVGQKDPAHATSEVDLACNLDKRTPDIPAGANAIQTQQGTWQIDKTIYDSFGNEHTMRINFTKVVGTPNSWQAQVSVDPNAQPPTNTTVDIGPPNSTVNTMVVNFDNLGTLQSATDSRGDTINNGNLLAQVSFDVPQTNPGPGGAPVRQTFNLNLGQVGSVVNTVTQFAEQSSTKAFKQDGYAMGYMEGFRIDQTGQITGVFTNGSKRLLGQVALATFANPGGLEKAGQSTYVVTNNSGDANVSPSGIAGKGKIIAGALEMSNVDLAEAFTDMIVTQRGFEANTKTIQTSDQMLQDILTLKR